MIIASYKKLNNIISAIIINNHFKHISLQRMLTPLGTPRPPYPKVASYPKQLDIKKPPIIDGY